MQWHKMTRQQQDYARSLQEQVTRNGGEVSVSQVAKYLDDFAEWDRGSITAAELERRTGHHIPEKK